MANFNEVKAMVLSLGYVPENEDPEEELFMVSNVDEGICNLVIDCEDELLILKQHIMDVGPNIDPMRLLQMSDTMVHGAFTVDEEKKRVWWYDTLELPNLDPNELESSINALSAIIAEHAKELSTMAKTAEVV